MPGQHFDLAQLGIDPAESDKGIRVVKHRGHWAYIVDPDVVGSPKAFAAISIDLLKRGARIYAKQQNRHEAEVLIEILATLDHYLQQPEQRSH